MRYQIASLLLAIFCSPALFAVEIPVNIGVGPAAFYIPEKVQKEEKNDPYYGLRLHIKAVIDQEIIKKYKNKIPAQYRKAVEKVDEIRVGYLLIPESIMIGTRKREKGPEIFGATWRPIGLGVPIKLGPARFSLGTGLLVTYAFLNTGEYKIVDQSNEELEKITDPDDIVIREQVTHFFRPGMDLMANLEIKFSKTFLTSFGWSSAYYIPQKIGGGIGSVGMDQLEKSLWRIHQAWVMMHYRIPVKANL